MTIAESIALTEASAGSGPAAGGTVGAPRRWRRSGCWLLAGLFLACAGAAHAFEVRFEGTGTPLASNEVQTVWTELGRLVRVHQTLFRRPPPAEFKITYHISRTQAEYEGRAERAGRSVTKMAGYTRSRQHWQQTPEPKLLKSESTIETWREQSASQFMAVVLHESAHAVTAGFVGAAPLWFKEGSAELLGTPAAGRFKMKRQEEGYRWGLLGQWLEEQRLPPLRRFLEAGSYEAWDRLVGGQTSVAYTMSYSVFFLLCTQAGGMPLVTAWVDANQAEEDEQGLERAFADYLDAHWPGGVSALERSWHALIRANAARAVPAAPLAPSRPPQPSRR